MNRRDFLRCMGFSAAAGVAGDLARGAAAPAGKDDRPNIVLIMADDMGYSDIGCYGGEVNTPALNRLASGGLRFTQFYNNAKCGPTRASLLTGLYSQQVGQSRMERGVTIGEVLRRAGYRTLMTGKWHQAGIPVQRGFDRYFGLCDGCCNFFNPGPRREGERLTRDVLGDARDLVENLAGLDDRDPLLGAPLALTHPSLGGLLGQRLVGEDANPQLARTFDVATDGHSSGLDLPRRDPTALDRLQAEVAERHVAARPAAPASRPYSR